MGGVIHWQCGKCQRVVKIREVHFRTGPLRCVCGFVVESWGDAIAGIGTERPKERAKQSLPTEILDAIEPEAQAHGMLLGDAIAAMTAAIGIPACGGCGKRKEWLNKAHQWVRSFFTERDPPAGDPR